MASLRAVTMLLALAMASTAWAGVFPYEQVGIGGANNQTDMTPAACNSTDGCRAQDGSRCSDNPGEVCDYARVPAGRCTAGSGPCIWPLQAGACFDDAAVPCTSDASCTGVDDAIVPDGCDLAGNNPACACQGSDPTAPAWEGTVCSGVTPDPQARCSDGDPDAETGGYGIGLCVMINLSGGIILSPNCGSTAHLPGVFIGPRSTYENPADTITPLRLPGTGLSSPDTPVNDSRNTAALDIDDMGTGAYAAQGVRAVTVLSDSWHADWPFVSGAAVGGLDANIVIYYCDPPDGWEINRPVSGECTAPDAGIFCIRDEDCPSFPVSACDPTTFTFCHEAPLDGIGYMWSRALSAAEQASATTCPPDCNSMADFQTGELELMSDVLQIDAIAAAQLAFDHLVGPPMSKGNMALVQPLVTHSWVAAGDNRCFIGGNPDVVNSVCDASQTCVGAGVACDLPTSTDLGSCSVSGDGCCINSDCFRCGDGITPCPSGAGCSSKNGICDDATGRSCDFTLGGATECGSGIACLPCGGTLHTSVTCVDCTFQSPAGNADALPIGYNDHSFTQLDLIGRMGGKVDNPSSIRVPILSINVNSAARSDFHDDTCGGEDDCLLGQDAGPVVSGVGTGGTFPVGTVHPVRPAAAPSTVAVNWPASGVGGQAPGGPPILQLVDVAPGPDGIPACVGDNDPESGSLVPCDEVLGGVPSGSTGSDDPPLVADYSAAQDGTDLRDTTLARFVVSDPTRASPVMNLTNATTIKDLDLLGLTNNLDVMTKAGTTWCPIDGSNNADCTRAPYCSTRGGDTDGDGFCDDDDPCDVFPNVPPFVDSNGDLIPNECQCMDTNGDGFVTSVDAFAVVACVANPACAQGPPDPDLWDANNDGFSVSVDAFLAIGKVPTGNFFELTCARRPEGTPAP